MNLVHLLFSGYLGIQGSMKISALLLLKLKNAICSIFEVFLIHIFIETNTKSEFIFIVLSALKSTIIKLRKLIILKLKCSQSILVFYTFAKCIEIPWSSTLNVWMKTKYIEIRYGCIGKTPSTPHNFMFTSYQEFH